MENSTIREITPGVTLNRSFKFSVSVYLQNWNNNLPPASVTAVAVTVIILIALKNHAKRNDIHYLVKNKIKQNFGLRLAAMYFIRHVQ